MKFLVAVYVACVLFVVAMNASLPALMPPAVPEKPLVAVGQTYAVVWSCLLQVGCYGEVMRIEALRADGWADVLQCDKDQCTEKWRVNLSQALSIQVHKRGRAAN